LRSWGFKVEIQESAPGRLNVIARTGPADSPALMFAGHLDTVGVEGMSHSPYSGEIEGDRLYGRGSADMKAGIAAMCCAAFSASEHAGAGANRQIIIAAVADEEYESLGMSALLDSGVKADCAILTEPTRLAICPAHRGFVWIEVEFTGRAAHGSRYDIGVDAIRHAGLLLAELDTLDATTLHDRSHPLLGRGSLHASTIAGGSGMSTYPESCDLAIERRTLPGETPETALQEIRNALDVIRGEVREVSASVTLTAAQSPSDVGVGSAVVKGLASALRAEGLAAPVEGLSAWTDAALLNEAGVPAVCFGPGDIALAHSAEEWVALDEIEKATNVLAAFATEWCN